MMNTPSSSPPPLCGYRSAIARPVVAMSGDMLMFFHTAGPVVPPGPEVRLYAP
jgi:hypothetical protein